MTLKTNMIRTRADLQTQAAEWNDLLEDSSAASIYLTWEWISAWLETVCPEPELLIVTVRTTDGRLVALAPFHVTTMRLLNLIGYRCLQVLGGRDTGAVYPDIIIRRGFEDQVIHHVIDALLTEVHLWDCIWLPSLASWTGSLQRLQQACTPRAWHQHVRPRDFAVLSLPETQDEYLARLSRKNRTNLRRKTRRLMEAHRTEFIRCEGREQLSTLLETLFELHRRRWAGRGQPGTFERTPTKVNFYRRFAPVALDKGWLRFYALEIEDSLRAVNYCYAYRGTLYGIQEGSDPDWDKESVGTILRHLLLQSAIAEDLREVDFGGEFNAHKQLWRAEPRQAHDLLIGRPSLKNQLLFTKNIWPTGRFLNKVG